MQKHASSDFVKNDGVNNEIVVLEEQLKNASRTQGKAIRDKLSTLTCEKDKFRSTLQEFEEKIEALNTKIQGLNDKIWKVSLKVSIIGRDLNNEYWFFKDEPSKLYVKELNTNQWGYYGDEESIVELENSLITKGVRERRLYEGLRKLKGKMRIKKSKDAQHEGEEEHEEHDQEMKEVPKEVEKTEEIKAAPTGDNTEPSKDVEMEVETDPKYEAYREEVDFEKHLDKAMQFSMKKSEISTRKSHRLNSNKMDTLSLSSIKDKLLELEEVYTESARDLCKVWAPYSVSEKIREDITEAEGEEQIALILLKLEEGFSNPMNYKPVDPTVIQNMEMDVESQSHTSSKDFVANNKIIEDNVMFYRNNRKIKKFWSSDNLKDSWKEYISNIQNGGISALFLGVCVFIDQAEEYIEKLNSKVEKKKMAEERNSSSKGTKKISQKDADRLERKRRAGFYKEESSEQESDDESKPRRTKRQRVQNESEFDEESVNDESMGEEEEEEEEADDDSQWDSNCYICSKPGEVICCESCTNVAHLTCLKLRVIPENDWYCETCLLKLQNKRQTRSSRRRR